MASDDRIGDEKLQYDINREAAKTSLSSNEIDQYEYYTGEKILPSGPSQIIQQAEFTFSSLRKTFEKQTENQVDALNSLNLPSKIDELKQLQSIF